MRVLRSLPVFLLLLLCLTACPGKKTSDSWVQALKDCGLTDINSDKILYFGPSNNVGPGSGWRETLGQSGEHVDYRLRFSVEELPEPKDFVQLAGANNYQCKGGQAVSFHLSGEVSGNVSTLPLKADLSNDFKRAKSVDVSIGGMAWDQIREVAYESYFTTLGAGNKFYEDMNRPDRLVLYRALAVKDLVMTYKFSVQDAAAIKAKYTGPLGGAGSGDIGGGLSADWKADNSLTITAPQKAWILGELAVFRPSGGFASAKKPGQPLKVVKIPSGTPIVVETAH